MLPVTEKEMNRRLEVTEENGNRVNGAVIPYHRGGRKMGDTNLPPELRTLIGLLANGPHGSVKATAEMTGISETHAQNLKQGKIDGEHKDPVLSRDIEKLRGTVYERALDKTLSVLSLLDVDGDDKDEIRALPVLQKARLARDLSAVTKNMTPEHREVNIGQVVVMNPGEKDESQYNTVIVNRQG